MGKKICLSISAHHPEHWQPAWGSESPSLTVRHQAVSQHHSLILPCRGCMSLRTVRLILEALISFFPTDPKGAVGSLDWTPAERNRLAREVGDT